MAAEFSVYASPLRIFTFLWLFLFCTYCQGEPIIAAPGDDVILPCRLDSEEDLLYHTVEWSKLDMEPDPQGRVPLVYLYRSRRIMTKYMKESFIPRVSLNPDGLRRGDATLEIRNVSLQDEGKYRCFIPGKNFRETVQLVVDPNGVRAPTMETSQVDIISTPDSGGNQIRISRSRWTFWNILLCCTSFCTSFYISSRISFRTLFRTLCSTTFCISFWISCCTSFCISFILITVCLRAFLRTQPEGQKPPLG